MAAKQEFESRFAKHKDELEWLFMELYHNRRTELTSSQFGCRDPIWHKSQQVH